MFLMLNAFNSVLFLKCGFVQPDQVATVETRKTQEPWIRWAKLPRKLHWIWTLFVVLAATLVNLSSILILEDVLKDRLGKVIPISLEPLHLLWMKSALHPSSGPPTDASCSCTLLPVCSQALLSEDVAKAKLGHRQNLNRAALNGAKLAGRRFQFPWLFFSLCNQWI